MGLYGIVLFHSHGVEVAMSSFIFSVGLLGALSGIFVVPFLASAVCRHFRRKRYEKLNTEIIKRAAISRELYEAHAQAVEKEFNRQIKGDYKTMGFY